MPCARPGHVQGFRQALHSGSEQERPRPSLRFLRMLARDCPDGWRQWRAEFSSRTWSPGSWRLYGGPCHGTRIDIDQQGLQRSVTLCCPDEATAKRFHRARPLIEAACSGPWLSLLITIRTECDTTRLPGMAGPQPPHG